MFKQTRFQFSLKWLEATATIAFAKRN